MRALYRCTRQGCSHEWEATIKPGNPPEFCDWCDDNYVDSVGKIIATREDIFSDWRSSLTVDKNGNVIKRHGKKS